MQVEVGQVVDIKYVGGVGQVRGPAVSKGNVNQRGKFLYFVKFSTLEIFYNLDMMRITVDIRGKHVRRQVAKGGRCLTASDFVKSVQSSEVTSVGGNVFPDLGFPVAEAIALKAESCESARKIYHFL